MKLYLLIVIPGLQFEAWDGHGGVLTGAVTLDLSSLSPTAIVLAPGLTCDGTSLLSYQSITGGYNGKLPNQDLLNAMGHLARVAGLPIRFAHEVRPVLDRVADPMEGAYSTFQRHARIYTLQWQGFVEVHRWPSEWFTRWGARLLFGLQDRFRDCEDARYRRNRSAAPG